MKKISVLLFAVLMVSAFTSCEQPQNTPEDNDSFEAVSSANTTETERDGYALLLSDRGYPLQNKENYSPIERMYDENGYLVVDSTPSEGPSLWLNIANNAGKTIKTEVGKEYSVSIETDTAHLGETEQILMFQITKIWPEDGTTNVPVYSKEFKSTGSTIEASIKVEAVNKITVTVGDDTATIENAPYANEESVLPIAIMFYTNGSYNEGNRNYTLLKSFSFNEKAE